MASAVARRDRDRDRDREGERERDRHRQRRSSPAAGAGAGARDGHSSRRGTSPLAKKREREEEEEERGSRHRERERERDEEGKKRDHRHSRHRSRSPRDRDRDRDSDRELRRHQPRERDAPPSPSSPRQHTTPLPHDPVAQMNEAAQALEAKQKQHPSFELSGKLAEETNKVRGVALIFTEPPEARKPDIRWRLYVFKGGDVLNEPLYVHRQSCYLFGRERRVADIPTDHPSCSKQHAVLQYRQVEKEQPDGMMEKQVRPYLMDLESTNGTFINDNRLEPRRYYELFEKDTIRFGNSSREYVLLHENSA